MNNKGFFSFYLWSVAMSGHIIRVRPHGRLGNSILQMQNAVMVALQYNVESVYFEQYSKKPLLFPNSDGAQRKSITDAQLANINDFSVTLFDIDKLKILLPDFDSQGVDRAIVLQKVRDFFLSALEVEQTGKDFDVGSLVIHIRSGDIFRCPHPLYVQPPYSYYKAIIEARPWKEIILVAEDRVNPTINAMLREYKQIQLQGQSFKDAVRIVLNASTVVAGTGYFVPEILALSRGVKHLFRFSGSRITRSLYDNGDCTARSDPICVSGYIERWKNTLSQRRKMIDFQLEQHCDLDAFKSLLRLCGSCEQT